MTDKTENHQQNDFNDEAYVLDTLMPLIKQVHGLCQARGIPFVAAFACGLDTETDKESKLQKFHMGGSCFLPDNDRVPPELALAHKLIFEGTDAAAPQMLAYALAHAVGARESRTEREWPAPAGATIN